MFLNTLRYIIASLQVKSEDLPRHPLHASVEVL